jgi:hypothetical protein
VLRSSGWLAWTIVAYLLAAAGFELVLALRHSTSPRGDGYVLLLALIAMLVAAILLLRGVSIAGLAAPAGALFVTAYSYTGDPYFRPSFRSYADGGTFSPTWIIVLLGLSLVVGLTTQLWRRAAPAEAVVVLALLIFTALFTGTGH